jgi:hypothetical protein
VLELENEGVFEQPALERKLRTSDPNSKKRAFIDWKRRFRHFRFAVPTFGAPFGGSRITRIGKDDEVAFFSSRLCTDRAHTLAGEGVYFEVDVQENPDNMSLAVVDFEAGGCSSITFSPDTGAVIRERKLCEEPRRVEGSFIQSLPSIPPEKRFHGRMGLYLHRGRLSFFRRSTADMFGPDTQAGTMGPWETTGFISDVSWAEGSLTPCVAFRDEGDYNVQIVHVGTQPPLPALESNVQQDGNTTWNGLGWEARPLWP